MASWSYCSRVWHASELIQWQSLSVVCMLCALAVAAQTVHRFLLHPLRNFPGPRIRAISPLPHYIAVLRGTFEFEVLQLHLQYGPVVRIAPNELAFADGKAWTDIYGRQLKGRENQKDHSVHPPLDSVPGSMAETLLFGNTQTHSRLRRITGPAFTLKATKKQEDCLQRLNESFIIELTRATATVSVQEIGFWYELLYTDHAGEFIFGETFGCLQSQKPHSIMRTIFDTIEPAVYASFLNRFGLWSTVNAIIPPKLKEMQTRLYDSAYSVADRRLARGIIPGGDDLFNHLLSQKDDHSWSRDSLRANGLHLVIAGSETVAFALTGITWLLCTHRSSLDTLQQEIRSAMPSEDEVTLLRVAALPYLTAVLQEGLRLYPPGALNSPRLISHENGQSVAGWHVPYKTTCAIHQYAAFRYDGNFTRPGDFVPERWLDDPPEEFKDDQLETMQPFSVGPRNCIASELAFAQMRLTLTKLLTHFDIELADSSYDWHSKLKAYWIWKRPPLAVKMTPRNNVVT